MLNMLWAAMIVTGIVYASLTGNMQAVSDGLLSSVGEAVSLCITMFGVIALWTGLMEIANKSGLLIKCTKLISPVMSWLFPRLRADSEAMQYMSTNIIANIFGLGWAATPAGLKAMECLVREDETHMCRDGIASDEMCTFLVLNISSLQLIPVNIIAYRSQYGSVNPSAIVLPAIIVTCISTVVAVIYCKLMQHRTGGRGV